MANKRVYELAKEHGMSSADVLEKLKAAGFEVKGSASSVDADEASKLLANGSGPAKKAAAKKPARKAPAKAKPAAADEQPAAATAQAPAAKAAPKAQAPVAEAAVPAEAP
ncbi:MAG TPA: translation initiation factor IF-2 N-terminal domain-containing protein, partial [Solirubrobacteraceae bacterium]|nr:translation initiation factor IF-2 N-terminal domain-containing protein [Solirubrobacteraceae bacterium]